MTLLQQCTIASRFYVHFGDCDRFHHDVLILSITRVTLFMDIIYPIDVL